MHQQPVVMRHFGIRFRSSHTTSRAARAWPIAVLACASALLPVSGALAQAYPSARNITMMVGFAAGSGTDAVARIVADGLSQTLGQKVVVENRPGAGGAIGIDAVAKAAPDGYTIGMASTSTYVYTAALADVDKKPYDIKRDFVAIGLTNDLPLTLASSAAIPPKNLKQLLEYMKTNNAPFVSAGPGTGAHVLGAALVQASGGKGDAVHYKGSAVAIPDLIAGRVFFTTDAPGSIAGLIKEGKLVGLAVLSSKRIGIIPDVPTIEEAWPDGPEYFRQSRSVNITILPSKTPRDIAERLNAAINKAQVEPAMRDRFEKAGLVPRPPMNLDQIAQMLNRDIDDWTKVIRSTGIRDAVKATVAN